MRPPRISRSRADAIGERAFDGIVAAVLGLAVDPVAGEADELAGLAQAARRRGEMLIAGLVGSGWKRARRLIAPP